VGKDGRKEGRMEERYRVWYIYEAKKVERPREGKNSVLLPRE
jgi:hypothetical protein